jgi:uncharacterized protein YndB with AHSA1/START domain
MAKKYDENDPGYVAYGAGDAADILPGVIFDAEKKHIKHVEGKPLTGLAVSGGGIRSASFGLGIMQALVANNQLDKIDYMSTVSGGGYLGSALTWALHQYKESGTTPETFPLGKRDAKKSNEDPTQKDTLSMKGNELLDFIRQHGNYLTPATSLDIVSFGAVVIRSMIMSLFVYFSFLTVTITAALWLIYYLSHFIGNRFDIKIPVNFLNREKGVMLFVGIVILVLIIFKGFIYSISTFFNDSRSKLVYKSFIKGQQTIGFMLKIGLTCMVFGSLPFVRDLISNEYSTMAAASGSTLFGTLVGLWQYILARKNVKTTGMKSDLLIYGGTFALVYGLLLLAYMSTYIFLDKAHHMVRPDLFLILIGLCILFGFLVNLNMIGPHNIWRNRLMEAFMPDKKAVAENKWKPALEADGALMADMCKDPHSRPYHIINTNIILANSSKVDLRARGGDNFIISPLYVGSKATGWRRNSNDPKERTKGITLATAMATSAAALNPNAGVSGAGVTRNIVVSKLLSLLNLRLGYWTNNPRMHNNLLTPNFFVPGLTSEIFGRGLTEDNRFIQLSDGGHFENLAFYELIRRKLDLIIVSDGGADPLFNFDDLANAIEKVRVDFATKISFIKDSELDSILPSTSGDSLYEQKYQIAKAGFAIADIDYNGTKKGKLVYVKLAMIEGLPTDIYSYKGMDPSFPHQSTADQFFNEKQFEVYRELGYYVGWQMMESKEGQKIFPANFRYETVINAPAQTVWNTLTNPEKIRKYMCGWEVECKWEAGSPLVWKENAEGQEKILEQGIIKDFQPGKSFTYTSFDPNLKIADKPVNYLVIEYDLNEVHGVTTLTVTEGDYAKVDEGVLRYRKILERGGWEATLAEIKKLAEAEPAPNLYA